jgi:hypothetical protein
MGVGRSGLDILCQNQNFLSRDTIAHRLLRVCKPSSIVSMTHFILSTPSKVLRLYRRYRILQQHNPPVVEPEHVTSSTIRLIKG